MKMLLILSIFLILSSCKCKKDTTTQVVNMDSIQTTTIQNSLRTTCLDDGKCTVEIFRNQSLDIKTDDLGSIYYNKSDNPDTSVILYRYDRNIPKGLQDANYSEQIVFEINNSDQKLTLSNEDLQKTKMLFGRFCYCKGAAGNYKIEQGNLVLSQKNNEVTFDLDFKITRVPQLINAVSETVK
jgi:hypothetical protein